MRYSIVIICLLFSIVINAQVTESGEPLEKKVPLDGITEKKLMKQKRVLPYAPIREADVFWEKRIWRVIDTREKMNLHFRYPKKMFAQVLFDALEEGKLTAYQTNDNDDFSSPYQKDEVMSMLYETDTITSFDPITYEETIEIVFNEFDLDDIKRFRIKEVWYFDEQSSTLKVRILGIAPMRDIYDETGNFLYEMPMFWVYYPHAREALAREQVFNPGNDNSPMSWTDLFEMRQFSSHIYKESNVYDRRIKDYASGVDMLLESKNIGSGIFNFEHDLWSY